MNSLVVVFLVTFIVATQAGIYKRYHNQERRTLETEITAQSSSEVLSEAEIAINQICEEFLALGVSRELVKQAMENAKAALESGTDRRAIFSTVAGAASIVSLAGSAFG